MDQAPTVDALILAGGQGSRLGGHDKGLLSFGSLYFAEHLTKLLSPYCRNLLISCNRNHDAYARFADRIITDGRPDYAGPLAGILAAAQASDADYLLITPCDTPNLDMRFPQRMLRDLKPLSGPRVADDGSRAQQLHLLLPRELGLDIGRYIEQGNHSVKGWLFPHQPLSISFSDCPGLFRNINTEAELNAWRSDSQLPPS